MMNNEVAVRAYVELGMCCGGVGCEQEIDTLLQEACNVMGLETPVTKPCDICNRTPVAAAYLHVTYITSNAVHLSTGS